MNKLLLIALSLLYLEDNIQASTVPTSPSVSGISTKDFPSTAMVTDQKFNADELLSKWKNTLAVRKQICKLEKTGKFRENFPCLREDIADATVAILRAILKK